MFYSIASVYLVLKMVLLYSLVVSMSKFDYLRERWKLVSLLYTALVAFLSYAFIFSWKTVQWAPWKLRLLGFLTKTTGVELTPWLLWILLTLILASLYFWILSKLELGMMFFVMILVGFGLVWF